MSAVPVAPPGERRLLRRIRRLFATLTVFVCGLDLLQLPTEDTAAGPVITSLPSIVIAAWAVDQYRRQRQRIHVADLVVPAMIVAQGWAYGRASWAYAISFVALWFRSMYGDRRVVVGNALLTYAGWLGAVVVTGGEIGPVDVFADVLAYLGTAAALHHLGEMAAEHDSLVDRERILTAISEQLLGTTSVSDVHRVAATGLLALLDDGRGSPHRATVWPGDRHRLWLAHAAGQLRSELPPTVELDGLPTAQVDAYLSGQPFSTDAETTAAVAAAAGADADYRAMVVVPLLMAGEPIGAVIGSADHPLSDPSLLTLLRRFGHEVSLSIDRAELTETLRAANDELREADELKNQFLSNVSHELRTPLTAICGFAQNLNERWPNFGDERRRDMVARIHHQAQRQRRLVDDLLLVSRMMAGTAQAYPEIVDVHALTLQAASALPLEGVHVEGGPAMAIVDPDHLQQIVTNLLTNASKYGAPPFLVDVTTTPHGPTITVRDHGDGVPAAFVPHMFERFRQADRATDARSSSGVGLGLAIVQELAQINGARIDYDDAGPGARFTVRLQAAGTAAVVPAPAG